MFVYLFNWRHSLLYISEAHGEQNTEIYDVFILIVFVHEGHRLRKQNTNQVELLSTIKAGTIFLKTLGSTSDRWTVLCIGSLVAVNIVSSKSFRRALIWVVSIRKVRYLLNEDYRVKSRAGTVKLAISHPGFQTTLLQRYIAERICILALLEAIVLSFIDCIHI